MWAFVAVAIAAAGLTTAGAFNYAILNAGTAGENSRTAAQPAPFAMLSSAASSLASIGGN